MKNISRLNRLHTFIIISTFLLSPVIANSQDLVSAQNEYECRVYKNIITKLTKQLNGINAELAACLSPQEMEEKKKEMTQVKSMKNPDNFQWSLFAEIAAKNNFKLKNCDESPQATFKCVADLEKKIKDKIDKTLSLNQTELLDKKNETARQLATYRSNLIDLQCDLTADMPKLVDIDGTWVSNKDVSYRIIQTESGFTWSVAGFHEKAEGSINGIKVSVKWNGDHGTGSATGLIILIDETGKATRIEWNNGLIFIRN